MWRTLVRVALSILCAGLLYAGWLAVFLLTTDVSSPAINAVRWLSAPAATAVGFAGGLALGAKITGTQKSGFARILPWPLFGCAFGAGIVYPFGPMLIVFGIFSAGTSSVIAREVMLFLRTKRSTAGESVEQKEQETTA